MAKRQTVDAVDSGGVHVTGVVMETFGVTTLLERGDGDYVRVATRTLGQKTVNVPSGYDYWTGEKLPFDV